MATGQEQSICSVAKRETIEEKNQPALYEWPRFFLENDHIKVRHRLVGKENESAAEIMNMRTGCS